MSSLTKKDNNDGKKRKRYFMIGPKVAKKKQMALTLLFIDTHFYVSTTDNFKNIVGKREIARNEKFLIFPQYFLLT